MTESALRLLLLARFLSFVALVYLGLHILFSRFITKTDSKLLWFFSVLTRPLTWPIRKRLGPQPSEARLRLLAVALYAALWLLLFIATEIAASGTS
jgi:hypothetical protein